MQYKTISLLALSASVMAAPEKRQATTSVNVASIYEVLATALPSSLVAEALTNSLAVYSEVSSEFAHSETPTWFTALPSDIQTYLVPVVTNSASLSSAIANATGAGLITSSPVANTSAIDRNGTSATAAASSIAAANSANGTALVGGLSSSSSATGKSSTGSQTSTKSGSSSSGAAAASGSSSSGSSSTSTGGASLPTALYGMGLAGVVGIVGVFAL